MSFGGYNPAGPPSSPSAHPVQGCDPEPAVFPPSTPITAVATNKTNNSSNNNPTAALTRVLTRLGLEHPSVAPVKAISVTEEGIVLVGTDPVPRPRDHTICPHPRSPTNKANNTTERAAAITPADTNLRPRCRVLSPHSTAIPGLTAMRPRHRSISTRASWETMVQVAVVGLIHPARRRRSRPVLRLLVAGAFPILGMEEGSLIESSARPSVQSLTSLLRITR